MNPEQLGELEEERRFLLQSLVDLEREHEAGDVDDHDYRTLRAGYTARTAQVLRDIEAGRDRPRRSPRLPARRWLVGAAVAAVLAVLAGVALARSVGERQPGQVITGGQVDEVAERLSRARQLLDVDPSASLALYREVLELDRNNVEALTYSGWLIVLEGRAQQSDAIVVQGAEVLAAATALDPLYPDAICLLGVAYGAMLTTPDIAKARPAVDSCLAGDPPASVRGLVESLQAELAADSSTTTVTISG